MPQYLVHELGNQADPQSPLTALAVIFSTTAAAEKRALARTSTPLAESLPTWRTRALVVCYCQ
jgi:hypothetical protein